MRTTTFAVLAAAASVAAVACAVQQAQVGHPLVGQAAPEFSATGTDGKTYALANVEKKAPMIMVFWKDPCPHNPRASSLVNSIVEAYKGKVNFVGVVNKDGETAKNFQQQYGKDYVFLQDGSKSIIGGFKMRQSIQFAVIGKDKKVEAVIGGYSQDSMSQLNAAMAKAAGVPEAKLDFSGAPTRTTYG